MKSQKKLTVILLIFYIAFSHPVVGQTHELLSVMRGHTSAIRSVNIDPLKEFLVSTGDDNSIRLWNLKSDKLAFTFQNDTVHTDKIWDAKFSLDGRNIVSVSDDRLIKVWDAFTYEHLKTLKTKYTRQELDNMPSSTARRAKRNSDIPSRVLCVVYGNDNDEIYTGHSDNAVRKWNLRNGTVEEVMKDQSWTITNIDITNNGRYIACSSGDNNVYLWNTYTLNRPKAVYKGHRQWVNQVAFHPTGNYLASVSEDNSIRIWDTDSEKQLEIRYGTQKSVKAVAFSNDGNYLATADNNDLSLWWFNSDTKQLSLIGVLKGHEGDITDLCFGPNDQIIYTAGKDAMIRKWDIYLLRVKYYFKDEIEKEKEKSGLFGAQGEFEKTIEYEKRLRKAKNFMADILQEYRVKYKEEMKKLQEIRDKERKESREDVTLSIDSIQNYNPDKEYFKIRLRVDNWKKIDAIDKPVFIPFQRYDIPIEEAKSFKKYHKKAKITGTLEMVDGKPRIYDIVIKHPTLNKKYSKSKK